MRAPLLTAALAALAACAAPESPRQDPLERLLESERSELCSGALADALRDLRRGGAGWDTARLRRVLRWSFGHAHDDCGSSVSGRALWMETIAALELRRDEEAGQALVASLRVSHRPASDAEASGAGLRELTEAALAALRRGAPWEASVVRELLDWYGGDGEDCSAERYRDQVVAILVASREPAAYSLSERFPPSPEQGRCAPGWLLSDVLAAAPPEVGRRVLVEVTSAEAVGEDLPRALELVDSTTGPLQNALAERACSLAVVLARRALEGSGEDPRGAVADSCGACAPIPGGAERIRELQRGLTRWLVERGQAEEAWTTLADLPEEDVADDWLAEVGIAVVTARLEGSRPAAAAELLELLDARLGSGHASLVRLRPRVRQALLDGIDAALNDGLVAEAGTMHTAVERLFGESEETRRLRVEIALLAVGAVAVAEGCPSAEEHQRLRDLLRMARETSREHLRSDEDIQTLLGETSRDWRRFERRCRPTRRR